VCVTGVPGAWGLSIALFTVGIKTATYPLNYKQMYGSALFQNLCVWVFCEGFCYCKDRGMSAAASEYVCICVHVCLCEGLCHSRLRDVRT